MAPSVRLNFKTYISPSSRRKHMISILSFVARRACVFLARIGDYLCLPGSVAYFFFVILLALCLFVYWYAGTKAQQQQQQHRQWIFMCAIRIEFKLMPLNICRNEIQLGRTQWRRKFLQLHICSPRKTIKAAAAVRRREKWLSVWVMCNFSDVLCSKTIRYCILTRNDAK